MKQILIVSIAIACYTACTQEPKPVEPKLVIPTAQQLVYQEMELIGFIHFTVNTFTDKEWGYGDEKPEIFNPTELDAEQWVLAAKEGGLKQLILTAKHHDGFCLWPSKYTEHSVKNSPWKEGKGDVVKEFVDACRKHGLKVGLYLSPWDRNHADYGKPEYITYYRNQLKELLTNYGEISEIWFDGANGGDGYYGGANETRHIDRKIYYDWENTYKLLKELQPNVLIFSDKGEIRWIGNERGFAGETNWSMIDRDKLIIGGSDQQAYLNTGDPEGKDWAVGECDVSIRPGWFYHQSQDDKVKTLEELMDIYYGSVGRNGVLLLNLPPDKRGLLHENDVKRLKEFGTTLKNIFKTNLAKNKEAKASDFRGSSKMYHPNLLLDENKDSYWATNDSVVNASVEIDLKEPTSVDLIVLKEYIKMGQRVKGFSVDVQVDGQWKNVAKGTTIGYKRILKIPVAITSKIRLTIEDANACPVLSSLELYKEIDY